MSGFRCGIVGLPNVGKSTIFSALSGMQVAAENYPFCTTDPNIAMVEVPDQRLKNLSQWVTTKKVIPATVEFVDIAGLIRGSSKGEGLGNQFLGNIRNVDAIIQVIRCFEASDIVHVDGKLDPISDLETIELELAFADFEVVEKRLENLEKKIKAGDSEAKEIKNILSSLKTLLERGEAARKASLSQEDRALIKDLNLLTLKPQIYVANIGEDDFQKENPHLMKLAERAQKESVDLVAICGKIEAEISQLAAEERLEFFQEMNIKEGGLERLIRAGYQLLGLRTFFTMGPKEIRAWTFPEGSYAPQAAGKIHTDFERGFIRAEAYHYSEMETFKSEKAIREAGKMRMEGKDYIVMDGDILRFHFN